MKRQEKLIHEFLICWTPAKYGSFQRAHLYEGEPGKKERNALQVSIQKFLFSEAFLKFLNSRISESENFDLIDRLEDLLLHNPQKIGMDIPVYGNAQKIVNIFIKGMWLSGKLKDPPPHFPVDSIILKALKKLISDRDIRESINKLRWTYMTNEQYQFIMNTAKQYIGGSLATWEASTYLKESNLEDLLTNR